MYESKFKSPEVDCLYEMILSLKTIEECYRFFDDVATTGEIQALSQRLQVAILLYEGEKYQDIIEKTFASSATISRVKKCLYQGSDGYKIVLARRKKKEGLQPEQEP